MIIDKIMKKRVVFIVIIVMMIIVLIYLYNSGNNNSKINKKINSNSEKIINNLIAEQFKTSNSTSCNKTIDDILNERGVYWGDVKVKNPNDGKTKTYTFSDKEQNEINKLLMDYYLCLAIGQNNVSYCKYVFNQKKCEEQFYNEISYFSFLDFINGKNNDLDNCVKLLSSRRTKEKAKIVIYGLMDKGLTYKDICNKIHNLKIDNVCNNINKINNVGRDCYAVFPSSESDCEINGEGCKVMWAFNISDPNKCHDDYCKAYLSKDKDTCNNRKEKLISTYCNYYQKLMAKKYNDEKDTIENFLLKGMSNNSNK